MSEERWDVVVKILNGPLSGLGEQVFRGPVVRVGAEPGPGGVKLSGYRGLDARHAVITAYTGGTASVAPVGTNQVRTAPHPNVNWKEIEPLRGPEYLSNGSAIHFGPVNRGATVQFVKVNRLGVWQQGDLASEAGSGAGAGFSAPTANRLANAGAPPAAYDARGVSTLRASNVPLWFLGILFMMSAGTAGILVLIVAGIFLFNQQVEGLGPIEEGYEFYESVDPEAVSKLDPKKLDGLNQAFMAFIYEPNINQSGGKIKGLDKPENWDKQFQAYTTASVEQHVKAWAFFRTLENVRGDYGKVLTQLRAQGLPDVFAAIPYQESRYRPDLTSVMCAKGYWQFQPEVAKRNGAAVSGCRLVGTDVKWTPTDLAPPNPMSQAAYIQNGQCILTSCDVDERMDLQRSTTAALKSLKEAWEDPDIAGSGAAVEMTITSHNIGYLDAKYGVPKGFNVLPAFQKWKAQGGGKSHTFIGNQIKSSSPHEDCSTRWCGAKIPPEGQHYAYTIVSQHILAACYYGMNYSNEAAFKPYQDFTTGNGYCKNYRIPSKEEVKSRGGKK